MTLEELLEMWREDCEIDKSDLDNESLNIPLLHHRYFKVYCYERTEMRKLEKDLKRLRHAKKVFYVHGPTTRAQVEEGWILPPGGKVLKSEAEGYVETDPEVMELAEKVAERRELIDRLEDIIKMINNRNFHLRLALDWQKFTNGQ